MSTGLFLILLSEFFLQQTGFGVRVASCGVRVAGCGVRVAGCALRGAGCGLRGTGCVSRVMPYEIRITGRGYQVFVRVSILLNQSMATFAAKSLYHE